MRSGLRLTMFAATVAFLGLAPGRVIAAENFAEKPQEDKCNPLCDQGMWRYQVRYRAVVEDLALTPEQLQRLDDLEAEMTAADEAEVRRKEAMSEAERAAAIAALKIATRAFAAARGIRFDELSETQQRSTVGEYSLYLGGREFDRRSATILRPEQRRRGAEIAYRIIGPEIFHREYRSPFELSIEQKLNFDDLLEQHRKEVEKWSEAEENAVVDVLNRDGVEAAVAAYSAVLQKLRARQRVVLEKLVEMLTERQKQTFERLRGKEFDVVRFDEEDARKYLADE